jgi:hypothetical protein
VCPREIRGKHAIEIVISGFEIKIGREGKM